MTKATNISPDDEAFRKLVVSLDGHQGSIAEALGVHQTSVSQRLHSEKHHQWWLQFKERRSKRKRRAKRQRNYRARKERFQQNLAILQTTHPEDALLRALLEQLDP